MDIPAKKPYENLTSDLCAAGYGGLFIGEVRERVNKFLSLKRVLPEDGIPLLAFLFLRYEDFREAAIKVAVEDVKKIPEFFPAIHCTFRRLLDRKDGM